MINISFEKIIRKITKVDFPKMDFVIGIGQGGMVPAALVACQLNKPLDIIQINYRDEKNQPRHREPKLLKKFLVPNGVRRILLVDDVSVTGATLNAAKALLKEYHVKTFVLIEPLLDRGKLNKGQADYVLFPEIKDCVNWPWKI